MSDGYDPTDLTGNEAARDERSRRDVVAKKAEEDDVAWLMGNKRGRRIVWRLLESAGVFRSSFSTNALATAFAEGNRNFGLRMLTLVHSVCPELYHPMLKEQTDGGNDAGRAHKH